MKSHLHAALLAGAAAAALVSVTACNRADEGALPPAEATTSARYMAFAPEAEALPAGEPVPVRQPAYQERYRWAEDAYHLNYAFESVPPDYYYDYDGYEPWVWHSDNDWHLISEPLRSGDRFYYYRPGSDLPFYVIDDDGYGYGYDDGVLVVVYNPLGALMPWDFVVSRADYGGRYLRRGRTLFDARDDARQIAIDQARWDYRQARIASVQTSFLQAALAQPDWRAYRARAELSDAVTRNALAAERQRRRDARAALSDVRRDLREAAPRRDTAPGAAKRAERANEVHRRNEARQEARQDLRDARREVREARVDARRDAREARVEARREGREARVEARREGREAVRDAKEARREARAKGKDARERQ